MNEIFKKVEVLELIVLWIIITTILIFIGFYVGQYSKMEESKPDAAQEHDSRIEIIEEGSIDYYDNYFIIADRETDVTYLMIKSKDGGVAITEIRESGGTVKLRE